MKEYESFDDYVRNTLDIEPAELTHISPELQRKKLVSITVDELINIWNEMTELKTENEKLKSVAEFQQASNMNRYFENKKLKEVLTVGSVFNKALNSRNKFLEEEVREIKMTKDEISKIKEHIEIHARREPRAIKITEILRKAVVELERTEELEKENAELKSQLEELKGCHNCRHFVEPYKLCCYSLGDEDYDCRGRKWEIKQDV